MTSLPFHQNARHLRMLDANLDSDSEENLAVDLISAIYRKERFEPLGIPVNMWYPTDTHDCFVRTRKLCLESSGKPDSRRYLQPRVLQFLQIRANSFVNISSRLYLCGRSYL